MSPRSTGCSRVTWLAGFLVVLLGSLLLCSKWTCNPRTDDEPLREAESLAAAASLSPRKAAAFQSVPVPSPLAMRLAAIEAASDPDARAEMLEQMAQSIAETELSTSLETVAEFEGPTAAEFRQMLVRRLAEVAPEAAAAWMARLPQNAENRGALVQVATAWAETDLPGALHWTDSLPAGEDKNAVVTAIAYEAARTEPTAALNIASALPATEERERLLGYAVSQWASTEPALATAWAKQVPDANLRQRLLGEVAIGSAKADAAGAATLVSTALIPGETQERAAVAIVQRWAQTSPADAAAWVLRFPDVPARQQAVENLVSLWAVQDSRAAKAWLQSLPAGFVRDGVLPATPPPANVVN